MRNNQLRLAVRYALAAGALATAAIAPTAFAQEEEAADLDRVQVTGSRIKRTDIEGALPVTVIDRETIELSAFSSVADLLNNLPSNSQGSFRPASGSSAQSFAGLSLRGLGEGRTLILIDGRRVPVTPNVGSAQDLNAIPIGAVERIEILSDGASAIYGTDAIGGVVNIITRKDYSGVEVMVGAGNPTREGGDTEQGHAIMGVSGAKGNMMFGASYNSRDIVFQRDREWSAGGASVFSNNLRNTTPNPNNIYGFSDAGYVANPINGSVLPGACDFEGFAISGTGASQRCVYDFTAQAADEAEIKNTSLFARGTYNINIDWQAYLNASVSRVESFGRYAPVPSSPWPGGRIFIPVGSPNHPAVQAPDDGYDPTVPYMALHRFAALGPRDTNTDANQYDFNIGTTGTIGDFDVDAGVRQVESQYYELGRNYVVGAIAQEFIASGRYDLYDPFSVDDATRNSMIATIGRDAGYKAKEAYAYATTDLWELPAGPVGLAFGAEYRDEDYFDIYDSLSEGGQIVGSAGNSAALGRSQYAAFFEVLTPVTDDLELNFAGRYDDYSDFGGEFSPKVSFRWQPLAELTVRGSYGQGFRAPTLDLLSAKPAFSADFVLDEATCLAFFGSPDCTFPPGVGDVIVPQVTTWVLGNPDMEAETSDQFSFGVAFEPLDWLNGTIDYWNIKVDNRLALPTVQTMVNCLGGATNLICPPEIAVLDPLGSPPFEELGAGIARVDGDGEIVYAQRKWINLGKLETDGIDLALRTNFSFGQAGTLRNELLATYTNSFKVDGGNDLSGEANYPEWRAVLANIYTWGDFTVAWNINYIHGQDSALDESDTDGLPSWTTHDIQVNYFTPWNGRVTVGVDNLGDRDPVVDFGESRAYNTALYDPYGRVVYVRYLQSF